LGRTLIWVNPTGQRGRRRTGAIAGTPGHRRESHAGAHALTPATSALQWIRLGMIAEPLSR